MFRRNLQRGWTWLSSHKEERMVNQQLHMANEIVAYAKQFEKPVIAMEKLGGIRT